MVEGPSLFAGVILLICGDRRDLILISIPLLVLIWPGRVEPAKAAVRRMLLDPLSAISLIHGSVAPTIARVAVTGTAPGMFATQ